MHKKPIKKYAPFGVNTKRFNKIGFHPNLDVSGAMKKEITKTGPGSYNTKEYTCIAKSNTGWKRKVEIEEFSAYLDYKNDDILKERTFRKTLLGPAWHDIHENKSLSLSLRLNQGFGTVRRFNNFPNNNPPPGIYTKGLLNVKRKQNFTKTPHLEWSGIEERFKDKSPPYIKPPNLYNPIDKQSLEEKTKTIVSLRGPYDLFTGPRNETTIKNHFAPRNFSPPDTYYIPPGDIDVLLKQRKRYGEFLKSDKFPRKPTIKSMMEDVSLCYKDPNAPGPADYNVPITSSTTKKNLISTSHSRFESRSELKPGVGRYNIKLNKCPKLKRPSWVFLSKLPRKFFTIPEEYAAF